MISQPYDALKQASSTQKDQAAPGPVKSADLDPAKAVPARTPFSVSRRTTSTRPHEFDSPVRRAYRFAGCAPSQARSRPTAPALLPAACSTDLFKRLRARSARIPEGFRSSTDFAAFVDLLRPRQLGIERSIATPSRTCSTPVSATSLPSSGSSPSRTSTMIRPAQACRSSRSPPPNGPSAYFSYSSGSSGLHGGSSSSSRRAHISWRRSGRRHSGDALVGPA